MRPVMDDTEMSRGLRRIAHEIVESGFDLDSTLLVGIRTRGVPIGAMGCVDKVAEGFSVGSHACTLGGNPLSAAAAVATLKALIEPGFIEGAAEVGEYFVEKLKSLENRHDAVVEVRGRGLMIGVEMKEPVAPLVGKMIEKGIICGPAGPNVLRFLPPLIITRDHVDRVATTLDTLLGEGLCSPT